jgi:hypothetical protein
MFRWLKGKERGQNGEVISIRGSPTQRRKRSITHPTPIPQRISPTTMMTNIPTAWTNENTPTLTAATANR